MATLKSDINEVVSSDSFVSFKMFNSRTKTIFPSLRVNYSASPNLTDADCPIAAIELDGFSPNKIINLISYEDEIYQNTNDFNTIETIYKSGLYFDIKHYDYSNLSSGLIDFLITDVLNGDSSTKSPVFYQYEFLYDVNISNNNEPLINVYRNNELKLDKSQYIIQFSTDLLQTSNQRYGNTIWRGLGLLPTTVSKCRIRLLFPLDFFTSDDYFIVEYEKSLASAKFYQRELVELTKLYSTNDFKIVSNGLYLTDSSRVSNLSNILYIVKDPCKKIKPLGITSIKPQSGSQTYLPDKTVSWSLRINNGSFLIPSGYYNSSSELFYYVNDSYNSQLQAITNVKPTVINGNIIKIKEAPIYVNETLYTYPDYIIQSYDTDDLNTVTPSGKIGIFINGENRNDINILSIDRSKGYIYLDKNLNSTDEVELSFYNQQSSYTILDNVELNPTLSGMATFNIQDYINTGIGIAIKSYSLTNSGYFYLYDPSKNESERVVYSIPKTNELVTSGYWNDASYMRICELHVNQLSKDSISYLDARRIGGGLKTKDDISTWFNSMYNNVGKYEKEWYSDNSYYDGYPLSNNGLIIIHIPEDKINSSIQKWIDYYIDQYKSNGDELETNIERATIQAISEFKYYLDQIIRRYISAGTDYILVPTISGLFSGSNILNLR